MDDPWKQIVDNYGDMEVADWKMGPMSDWYLDDQGREWGEFELSVWVWRPLAAGTIDGHVHG